MYYLYSCKNIYIFFFIKMCTIQKETYNLISFRAKPLAQSLGQIKLDSDKCKF
jgi:hypothetical protein